MAQPGFFILPIWLVGGGEGMAQAVLIPVKF